MSVRLRIWLVLVSALVALAVAPPHLPEALQAQRALAQNNPEDPEVLNDLGNLLMLAGELAEAEAVYGRALQLAPDRPSTRYNLALLLQETGRNRQAVKEYERVLEHYPRHAWAHYQLGTIYAESARRARAVKHYAQALALDPDLIRPEVNPHIVENELVTDALLVAGRSASPASIAPRLYQQPSRVADLLAPSLERIRKPLTEERGPPTQEYVSSRHRIEARWAPPPAEEDEDPEEGSRAASGEPLPREGDEGEPLADQSDDGDADQPEPPPGSEEPRPDTRLLTVQDLLPSQSGQVIRGGRPSGGGGSTERPSPPSAVSSSPPGLPSTPTTGTPPDRQPGLPSTGRLDLELLPSDAELLAALLRPSPAGS
ncbi:MAG: tetratricopeptide repeat protein [Thermoanaerobaculia bacterium]